MSVDSPSLDPSLRLSSRMAGLRSSAIRDLLTFTARPEVISLAGGLPAVELVPRERIARAAQRALGDPRSVQYGETSGWAPLRETVASRESDAVGRRLDSSEVVITHGSQQALSLLAQVLLDPGDTVVVEEPGYTGALQAFGAAQAALVPVALDADGMDTAVLEEALTEGLRPKVVHTVSNFHNPRGVVLSAQRREHLASLADRYGFWIIEDDPYGELWFDAPAPAPVAAHSDRVLRLSSGSKTLAPALRVGWLHGDRRVCEAVELIKQGTDLCGSSLTQRIATELLDDGAWLDTHLATVRGAYAARSGALIRALESAFGERLSHTEVFGGMFCWIEFTDGCDTTRLLERAIEHDVAFVPGGAFGVAKGHPHAARLCFATYDSAALVEGVDRLRRAYDAHLRTPWSATGH
ncbi:aminotransferase-like domain-containing protein [Rhodococcus spongiicola]|uniref:PLP-dependent aminotransferase family protein n=1 Tax=Rhodococcus spongiicola TaxID=2487352 RepID=A0A3S3A9A8_9NOCA|nr:PLP-dependent aminotransferase family protein [Rhodococcus spongiicola]RVW04965.1 PLP-dependent aminotransferase family protein [Rhodococcus spongiicola]